MQHWANGGETKLANLVTLCTFHHRLVHEGGFGVRVTSSGDFDFTRPDGSVVEPNGRVPPASLRSTPLDGTLMRQDPSEPMLFALHREHGLAIDAQTSRCGWGGEPMDYSMAIEGLWRHRGASQPEGGSPEPRRDEGREVRAVNPIHAMDHPLAAVDDDLSIERWEEKNRAEPSPSPDTSEANDAELPDYMRGWTQSSPEFLKLMAELGQS